MGKKRVYLFGACLIAFIALLLIATEFDSQISKSITENRTEFLSEILLGLTFFSSELIIFFFLTSLFLWQEHKRRWILPLWMSLAGSAVISYMLKITVRRPRPFEAGIPVLPAVFKDAFLTWDFSFPSFQAMLVFSALPILNKEFPKFKYIWVVFAALVGFSRIYFGVHYATDVLTGGLIGYLIGLICMKIEEKGEVGKRVYRLLFKKSR